jgi:hypothetical protein
MVNICFLKVTNYKLLSLQLELELELEIHGLIKRRSVCLGQNCSALNEVINTSL